MLNYLDLKNIIQNYYRYLNTCYVMKTCAVIDKLIDVLISNFQIPHTHIHKY